MTAFEVPDVEFLGEELMHGFDVVADGRDGKAWPVEWLGRIAGGRGASIAEELGGDEELACRVERLSGSDEPFITIHVGHVVRGQQNGVVARGVEVCRRCRRRSSLREA